MKKSDEFLVQFEGLKLGSHHFDWELDETFFDGFGEVEAAKGSYRVDMELLKQNNMLILEFDLNGTLPCSCDLCLDDITVPVEHSDRLVVKFAAEAQEPTEEMVVLRHGDYEIDVKQFIYEFIAVSLPLRRTCADAGKTCNAAMLEKLSEFNLTEPEAAEPSEPDGHTDTDSTWDALKSLKDKFRNN